MTTTTPRCEMFCSEPLDADADPVDPDGDFKNMCSTCRAQLFELTHIVLPAIRRDGFYSPPGATDDQRLRAMVDQADARPKMREALQFLDAVPTTDGRRLADLWSDDRWPDDGGSAV